jgi:hypothetical protein
MLFCLLNVLIQLYHLVKKNWCLYSGTFSNFTWNLHSDFFCVLLKNYLNFDTSSWKLSFLLWQLLKLFWISVRTADSSRHFMPQHYMWSQAKTCHCHVCKQWHHKPVAQAVSAGMKSANYLGLETTCSTVSARSRSAPTQKLLAVSARSRIAPYQEATFTTSCQEHRCHLPRCYM